MNIIYRGLKGTKQTYIALKLIFDYKNMILKNFVNKTNP